MDQTIILVDEKDKFKGYITWKEGHYGRGRRHRGFVVLLFDEKGNVYLQKRKHRVFDGLWDLTAISHPYRLAEGTKVQKGKSTKGYDESLEEAALRSLKNEMGIGKVELKDVGAFTYFAKDGDWCENEYCHVLVGKFDGRFKPNKKLVYEAKKVKFEEFVEDVKKNPSMFTPWAIKALKSITSTTGINEELEQDLAQFKKEFEKYAEAYFAQRTKLTKKYPKLIQTFYRELEEFGQGGKRLRPYLVWLGYRVSGGSDLGRVLPVCLAIELLHNFLLIHDDIVDKSETRRGRPTVHKKIGVELAIILGDIASMEAFGLIEDTTIKNKIVKVLLETAYGEALDIDYAGKSIKLADIFKMTELKTARYSFVGPLIVGYTLGQIREAILNLLEKYGLAVGIAYQLQDDILGVFGDEKQMGKSVLSDMQEGKNTVLIRSVSKKSVKNWGNKNGGMKEIIEIRKIVEATGAKAKVENRMHKEVKNAKVVAAKITRDDKLKAIFESLAEYAIGRTS